MVVFGGDMDLMGGVIRRRLERYDCRFWVLGTVSRTYYKSEASGVSFGRVFTTMCTYPYVHVWCSPETHKEGCSNDTSSATLGANSVFILLVRVYTSFVS